MSTRQGGCAGGCLTACDQEGCVVLGLQKGRELYDAQESSRC